MLTLPEAHASVSRMSSQSWKRRRANGGYWRMTWVRCNQKGCRWEPRLRWTRINYA